MPKLTAAAGRALVERALATHPSAREISSVLDQREALVGEELQCVFAPAGSHQERCRQLPSQRPAGGSALDRRLISEGLALLERGGLLVLFARLFAARKAAAELVRITGWSEPSLLQQAFEDTCRAHRCFACPDCFA